MENFQIRFGRVTANQRRRLNLKTRKLIGQRASTLVTFRKDDTIFFGISKRNLSEGWNKGEGIDRASDRLDLMLSGRPKSFKIKDGITVHHSGVFGSCSVDNVENLINYFREVTDYLPKKDTSAKKVAD